MALWALLSEVVPSLKLVTAEWPGEQGCAQLGSVLPWSSHLQPILAKLSSPIAGPVLPAGPPGQTWLILFRSELLWL